MTESPSTGKRLSAAQAALIAVGPSCAEFATALEARRTTAQCHCCGQFATTQWPRQATPEEARDHWDAVAQNIRASNDGQPEAEYVADRTNIPVRAVHGCDQHPDPCPGRTRTANCAGHGSCRCAGR